MGAIAGRLGVLSTRGSRSHLRKDARASAPPDVLFACCRRRSAPPKDQALGCTLGATLRAGTTKPAMVGPPPAPSRGRSSGRPGRYSDEPRHSLPIDFHQDGLLAF